VVRVEGNNAAGIVAVVALVLTALNLLFLWLNARATREHERRMRREIQSQQRIETTYGDLLTMMHHAAANIDVGLAGLILQPEDLLSSREISEVAGKVKTFGGDEVKRLVDDWSDVYGTAVEASRAQPYVRIVLEIELANLRDQETLVRDAIRKELNA
jgi:hypothetical protein